jgi:DNA-binding transcriptional regulator YhcF (GntR family)
MEWKIDPAAADPLHEQISTCIVRAIETGELAPGDRLPPASEIASVLDVNPNTVLHAYRRLRDLGTLEFRRGRGVRVSPDARERGDVVEAARAYVEVGRKLGYSPQALAALIEKLG